MASFFPKSLTGIPVAKDLSLVSAMTILTHPFRYLVTKEKKERCMEQRMKSDPRGRQDSDGVSE